MPGLLTFRSDKSEYLWDNDFVDAIWVTVEDTNSTAESVSQIGRERFIPLPFTRKYPQADKGTIIRARVYEEFAPEISAMYERLGNSGEGTLRLEIEDLERWLLRFFREILDLHLRDTEEDFYSAGVDRPQAKRGLNIFSRYLFLNGKTLNTCAIHDAAQNTSYISIPFKAALQRIESRKFPIPRPRCQLRILIPYWLL